jgi:two-component system, oxyanion-binding sensor
MMRIGLLKLTDAAPVIMAAELGLFAGQGAEVVLSVEPSWANIADKLTHGFLDAAVVVPPLAFAVSLGLRGTARSLIVPLALSLGGNTITLERGLARRVAGICGGAAGSLARARALASVIATLPGKPVLAVVHVYSTHNLLLRYWLAAGGMDPDNDVDLVVVPPAQTVEALASGRIAGFCAGAPWGAIAEAQAVGATIATSHDVWRNGPEKVLAVREDWAGSHPDELQSVLRALLLSARYCDDPHNAGAVASTLASSDYLGVDAATIRRSLPGAGSTASVFFRHAATYPWLSHAEWFFDQMRRWNLVGEGISAAARIYRPDLYALAASATGNAVPGMSRKDEGHASVWQVPADPVPIIMEPDGFFDLVPDN